MKKIIMLALSIISLSAIAGDKYSYVNGLDSTKEKALMDDYYYPLPNPVCNQPRFSDSSKIEPLRSSRVCIPGYSEYWYFLDVKTSQIRKYQVVVQLTNKKASYRVVSLNQNDRAKQLEFQDINNRVEAVKIGLEAEWANFYHNLTEKVLLPKGTSFLDKSAPNCAANGNEDADSSLDYFNGKNGFAFRNKVKNFIESAHPEEVARQINGFQFSAGAKEVSIGGGLNWSHNRETGRFATADGGVLAFSIHVRTGFPTAVLNLEHSKTPSGMRFSDFMVSENGSEPGDRFKLKSDANLSSNDACEAAEMEKTLQQLTNSANIATDGRPHNFNRCTTAAVGPYNVVIDDYVPVGYEIVDGKVIMHYERVTHHISIPQYETSCG